jgi:hypothetical protein
MIAAIAPFLYLVLYLVLHHATAAAISLVTSRAVICQLHGAAEHISAMFGIASISIRIGIGCSNDDGGQRSAFVARDVPQSSSYFDCNEPSSDMSGPWRSGAYQPCLGLH